MQSELQKNLRRFGSPGLAAAMLTAGMLWAGPTLAKPTVITIGTGGKTGVYYAVGSAICRLVNRARKSMNVVCRYRTGGSVANIKNIRAKKIDIAIAQADWHYHAYNGTDPRQFPDGPFKQLRSLFSVHPEPYTVLIRPEAKIDRFNKLKGMRIDIGPVGSGQRGTSESLFKFLGWSFEDFKQVDGSPPGEQARKLCGKSIDAMIITLGHPAAAVMEAISNCNASFLPVEGSAIEKFVTSSPFYSSVKIRQKIYRGSDASVDSFGVRATVVTSTALDDGIAYHVVKSVFEGFKRFRRLHPALNYLEPTTMLKDGLTAPLHPGAIKYYKEKGWR
jgi:TRAP transporter TAXI family solute receptor